MARDRLRRAVQRHRAASRGYSRARIRMADRLDTAVRNRIHAHRGVDDLGERRGNDEEDPAAEAGGAG